MTPIEFEKGERVSAVKMNDLSGRVASGGSRSGGIRSRDGVTPLKIRNRDIKMQVAPQLSHSFLPIDNGDETFDVTRGLVRVGESYAVTLPASGSETSIDYSVSTGKTHFQIKVDLTSTPVATWEAGSSFSENTIFVRYFPVIEFTTAGNFSSIVRHQTSDIHISIVPSTTTPTAPAATAAVGSEIKYARGDHGHAAPMLHLIKPATSATELVPTTDDSTNIQIGTWDGIEEEGKRWAYVGISATEQISMGVGGVYKTHVTMNANDVFIEAQRTIQLKPKGSAYEGYLELYNIPSGMSVGANRVWVDSNGFLKLG